MPKQVSKICFSMLIILLILANCVRSIETSDELALESEDEEAFSQEHPSPPFPLDTKALASETEGDEYYYAPVPAPEAEYEDYYAPLEAPVSAPEAEYEDYYAPLEAPVPAPEAEYEEYDAPVPAPEGEYEEFYSTLEAPVPTPEGEYEDYYAPAPAPEGEYEDYYAPLEAPVPSPEGEYEDYYAPGPAPEGYDYEDYYAPAPAPEGEYEYYYAPLEAPGLAPEGEFDDYLLEAPTSSMEDPYPVLEEEEEEQLNQESPPTSTLDEGIDSPISPLPSTSTSEYRAEDEVDAFQQEQEENSLDKKKVGAVMGVMIGVCFVGLMGGLMYKIREEKMDIKKMQYSSLERKEWI